MKGEKRKTETTKKEERKYRKNEGRREDTNNDCYIFCFILHPCYLPLLRCLIRLHLFLTAAYEIMSK
jgi:hypothetical protein